MAYYGLLQRKSGCGCGCGGGCGKSGAARAQRQVAQVQGAPSVIKKVEEAILDEKRDELFYRQLANVAPTSAEKNIILGIAGDEERHNRMFRWLYRSLSGRDFPMVQVPAAAPPAQYLNGIAKALFGEIEAIESYRKIYTELPAGSGYRDLVFNIMTDEFNHQTKFNYLFSLNVNKR